MGAEQKHTGLEMSTGTAADADQITGPAKEVASGESMGSGGFAGLPGESPVTVMSFPLHICLSPAFAWNGNNSN